MQRGILKVGQKILICGAEMVSSAEHGHPLQVIGGLTTGSIFSWYD